MTVAELCSRAEFDEDARELAVPGMPLRAYVEKLASSGRLRDATAALAQLLPKKDAIRWGMESVRKVPEAAKRPGAEGAMQAVDAWLGAADDATRRAAMQAAERAGVATPAGCL